MDGQNLERSFMEEGRKFPLNEKRTWTHDELYGKIYDEYLDNIDGYDVWLVYGNYLMVTVDMEFVIAGNDRAKNYIPDMQVWLDRNVPPQDRMYVCIHEITENKLMREGMTYQEAHTHANAVEYIVRKETFVPKAQTKSYIK